MSRMPSGCWTYIVPLLIVAILLGLHAFGDFLDHLGR
jgi:hypothetical protein